MINLHARSRQNYPVEGLCILFGRTRQAFYKFNEEGMARRIADECFAVDFIKGIRSKDHGIGGLKLWYMYQRRFPGEEALRLSGSGQLLCTDYIRDGINANNYGSDYKIEKTELDHSQTIELKMAKGGEYNRHIICTFGIKKRD